MEHRCHQLCPQVVRNGIIWICQKLNLHILEEMTTTT